VSNGLAPIRDVRINVNLWWWGCGGFDPDHGDSRDMNKLMLIDMNEFQK